MQHKLQILSFLFFFNYYIENFYYIDDDNKSYIKTILYKNKDKKINDVKIC